MVSAQPPTSGVAKPSSSTYGVNDPRATKTFYETFVDDGSKRVVPCGQSIARTVRLALPISHSVHDVGPVARVLRSLRAGNPVNHLLLAFEPVEVVHTTARASARQSLRWQKDSRLPCWWHCARETWPTTARSVHSTGPKVLDLASAGSSLVILPEVDFDPGGEVPAVIDSYVLAFVDDEAIPGCITKRRLSTGISGGGQPT